MPTISMFYGILVLMYYEDTKKHNLPHIHARYQGHKIAVSIPDGEMLDGSFPRAQLRLLLAWIELRKAELMADWELAISGQELYKIDPL